MFKNLFLRLAIISIALTSIVSFTQGPKKVNALQLPPWSNSIEISAYAPTSSTFQLAVDASEDGDVVAAIWRAKDDPNPLAKEQAFVAIGWTDGSQIKWTAPAKLSSNPDSNTFYHAVSVSGDGRTVVAAWTEQSDDPNRPNRDDDITYAVGAISINPSTNVPSVTWTNARQVANDFHDWYPSIDVNYDGTKVLITHRSVGSGILYVNALVGTITISGTTRNVTMKGPGQIGSIGTDSPLPPFQLTWRASAKISRDGKRGVAAWWNPTTLTNGLGRVEAAFGNLDFSALTFPSSLSGSAWSSTTLSPLEVNSYSRPTIDLNDAGTRAVVAWGGENGSNNYVSARTANITSSTSGTWTVETKLMQNLSKSPTHVRANIDAEGERAFVAWSTGPDFQDAGSTYTVVGTLASNGAPSWQNASVVQAGTGHYGVHSSAMSRDGSTAIAVPLLWVNNNESLKSTATNIWLNGSTLETDWETTLSTVTTSVGSSAYAQFGSTISKDGSLMTVVWVSAAADGSNDKVLSRVLRIGSPTITAISPTSGALSGGDVVTITGTNFRPEITVTIGGTACSPVVFVSSTEISCTTGAGTAGASDVVVTNPNSLSDTLQGQFTYNSPPSTPSDSNNSSISSGSNSSTNAETTQQGNSSAATASGLRVTDPTVYTRAPRQVSKNSAISVLADNQTKTYTIKTSTQRTCIPTKKDVVFINEGRCTVAILDKKTGKVLRRLQTLVVKQGIQELRVGNEVAVITPIYFANGSSRLTTTAKNQLRQLRNSMSSASSALVMGHTGIVAGNTRENILLSRKRAANTINELKKSSVESSFYAWAMGARDPATKSKRWQDQAMNRRAVIVLVP